MAPSVYYRSEKCDNREDARAPVSDQQMRNSTPRYPVDRYLIESSKKFDMVNIIDDDIWNTEPTLKPEDEILLRRLHEMLHSTSDDLKMLSGELSKLREPGMQVKMTPTPLDEEFNEKVHIEEIVNAKFHGYKIISKPANSIPEEKTRNDLKHVTVVANRQQSKISNILAKDNVQKLRNPIISKNLGISRTKIMQINGNSSKSSTKTEHLDKLNNSKLAGVPSVAYNEFSFKYEEPKSLHKKFQVQNMPSISIRSELKEQKVLQLDIVPNVTENEKPNMITKNVAVIAMLHETKPSPKATQTYVSQQLMEKNKPSVRKVSKLSTCESSGSTSNANIEDPVKLGKCIITSVRLSPKSSTRSNRKQIVTKKESKNPTHLNIDEWRKKLNAVYGTSNINKNKTLKSKSRLKPSPKKLNIPQRTNKTTTLNNAEYIPYSKLTIGGVKVSEIEKEISNVPDKNDFLLSPVLDRILSSRENSFSKNSSRTRKPKDSPKVFTTSDENLLQEVIDIERTVSETLSKDLKKSNDKTAVQDVSSESDDFDENNSYADDFEDEKSETSCKSKNIEANTLHSNKNKYESRINDDEPNKASDNNIAPSTSKTVIHNRTKNPNLSIKNSVDVYEFLHSVDVQDSATQSNANQKISLKETQTSPRNDNNIQPIHNDLWPTVDPMAEIEKMFKMEKEFIKTLIVEQYGDLLEKNFNKPSTSKGVEEMKNIAASQKNTQTSPAHVKNVMTSPTRTKTRTTSPLAGLAVDHHTSPLIFVTSKDDIKVEIGDEDLGISINLSSPRFSLRLPQNFQEVLSNLGDTQNNNKNIQNTRNKVANTSSIDANSSETSSFGEVRFKPRRKLREDKQYSSSESMSSPSTIHSFDLPSGILPLRSEGEMSAESKKIDRNSKSEGETSVGLI